MVSEDFSDESVPDFEKQGLIGERPLPSWGRCPWCYSSTHLFSLYASNIFLLVVMCVLVSKLGKSPFRDPTLGVYCEQFRNRQSRMRLIRRTTAPANIAIEYIPELKFRSALFEKTPYMGFPSDETDRLWQDLYNCMWQSNSA